MENQKSVGDAEQLIPLAAIIKNKTRTDLNKLIRKIIKDYLLKEKDLQKIHDFFTFIYDNIYYDIIFKKISINKQTVRTLETLAMPIFNKKIIDTILKRL
ncbi:MAG: hypothetical protein WC606_05580 [Candidatus Absconditabacterales bacterium]|jgi:hypothetical protein